MNNKPLVSYCIFFYNQKKYVKDALESAFSQDYENMEIIVSDDGSTDGTYELILEIAAQYSGPHRLVTNRNIPNLGISKHFNKVVYKIAQGDYLVMAGGDDVSLSNRVSVSVDFLKKFNQLQSVTFISEQVDENLLPRNIGPFPKCKDSYSIHNMDDYCDFENFVLYSGDSRTFKRSLIDFFPPLSVAHEEDLEFFFRSMLLGGVGIIRTPMVKRRWTGENASGKPLSRKLRKDQKEQLSLDLNFAYKNNIINDYQYECLKKKISSIYRTFCDLDDRRRHPYIFRGYRLVCKILHRTVSFLCAR